MSMQVINSQQSTPQALLAVDTETGELYYSLDGGTVYNPVIGHLIAGDGIAIDGGTIRSNLTGGDGIGITGSTVSAKVQADNGIYIRTDVSGTLVFEGVTAAGDGITINPGGTISVNIGAGLAMTGGTIKLNAGTTHGLYITAGGALDLNLVEGNGIEINGSTISAYIGDGLTIGDDEEITLNLTAGDGINVSGSTVSVYANTQTNLSFDQKKLICTAPTYSGGTGITVSSGTISTNLTGGSGITVSGATISLSNPQ